MHHRAQNTESIRREIIYILQSHIADPRLQGVSITAVELPRKADYATVRITQRNPEHTIQDTLTALNKAASKIRYYLSQRRKHIYKNPKLRFIHDKHFEKQLDLYQLINQTTSTY